MGSNHNTSKTASQGACEDSWAYDGLCSSYIYDLATCCCYDRMPRAGDTQNYKGYLTRGSGGLGVQGRGPSLVRAFVLCLNTTEETER